MRQWEKVRGWEREKVGMEKERGRETVSNSVWSPDPLYGADKWGLAELHSLYCTYTAVATHTGNTLAAKTHCFVMVW